MTAHPLGVPTKNTFGNLAPDELALDVVIIPVVIDPGGMFGDQLEVAMGNTVVKEAHTITIAIYNSTSTPTNNRASTISFDFPDTRILRAITQTDGMTITTAEASRRVRLDGDHKISISLPRLGKDQTFRVVMIASGKCGKPAVVCREFIPDHATLLRFETNDIIDQNLAQMEPRLLLSNQRMYRLWHESIKKHPWVRRLPVFNKDRDNEAEV
jgi:hypothetical protein